MRRPDRLPCRAAIRLAVCAALVALASCGKQDTPSPKAAEPPKVAAPAPPPPPPPKIVPKPTDVAITGVHLGLGTGKYDHVATETTTFAVNDKVMVSVYSDGSAKTASIGVTWLTAGGGKLAEETRDVQYNGSLATLFAFPQPDALVPGSYKVEVRLNEWLADTATFTVK